MPRGYCRIRKLIKTILLAKDIVEASNRVTWVRYNAWTLILESEEIAYRQVVRKKFIENQFTRNTPYCQLAFGWPPYERYF